MKQDGEIGEQFYGVEKILDRREGKRKGKKNLQYLIKWTYYSDPTWEPEQCLEASPKLKQKFDRRYEQKKRVQAQTLERRKRNASRKKRRQRLARKGLPWQEVSADQSSWPESLSEESDQHGKKKKKIRPIDKMTFPRVKGGESAQKKKEDSDESEPEYIQNWNRQGDIEIDQIKEVLELEKKDDTWMVKVSFVDKRFKDKWVRRDVVRLVAPTELIDLYLDTPRFPNPPGYPPQGCL